MNAALVAVEIAATFIGGAIGLWLGCWLYDVTHRRPRKVPADILEMERNLAELRAFRRQIEEDRRRRMGL